MGKVVVVFGCAVFVLEVPVDEVDACWKMVVAISRVPVQAEMTSKDEISRRRIAERLCLGCGNREQWRQE
jgi:hypothetical protein